MRTKTSMQPKGLHLPSGGWRWQRWLRRSAVLAVGILACIVLVQVLYPSDRALPLLRLGGEQIGGFDRQRIMSHLQEFGTAQQVTVVTPSRQWHPQWGEVGLAIDQEASAAVAIEYAWWERLIPFSSVFKIAQSHHTPFVALVDKDRLRAFAEKLVAEDAVAAQDAVIRITDGQVHIDAAKSGYRFESSEVARQLQALPLRPGALVHLIPQPIPPSRPPDSLSSLQRQAQTLLERRLELKVSEQQFQPERKQIGNWLRFVEDPSTKQLMLQIDQAAIKQYLAEIDKAVQLPAGVTTVTLLDGQEVGRSVGQAGRTVAVDAMVKIIESELQATSSTQPIALQIAPVPPTVNYVRTYSQASSGLQALLNDWEAANYGDYGIIIKELSGQHRSAEHQPDKRFVTASTYKMFLAYTVFQKIDAGVITLSQRTDMGWTVDECMREMIVNSTNPCAISLQNLVGWEEVDTMLHQAGFTATFLNNRTSGDKYSTVRDETNFLLRVYSHSLMSADHSEYLLNLLKRQVWRSGIPSGVPRGTIVADKVGLYNGWVHDVAIVFGPKSTYILGIMSKGGSDPQFADLSRRVYNFFNQ